MEGVKEMADSKEIVIDRANTPHSPLAFYRAQGGGAPDPNIGEAPLVLGHALGSSKDMWTEVLTLLPSNLKVILWEQPGHGNSGLLQVGEPSALDTAAAIHDGLNDMGVGACHIAGLSLGGMTTLAFAQRYPNRAMSFAVLDSGPASPPPGPWLERAQLVQADGFGGLVDGTMERWFTPSFVNGEGAEAVARIRRIFLETSPAGYAQCCQILAHTDLRSQLDAATSPALVLTGAEDPGTTPQQAEELAQGLPGLVEVVIVKDAAHLTAVQQPHVVSHALLNLMAVPGARPRPERD